MNKQIGCSFLVEETEFNNVFIVEEFDKTSLQMIEATREFVKKEIEPNVHELENKNYELVKKIMKNAFFTYTAVTGVSRTDSEADAQSLVTHNFLKTNN